MTGEELEKIVLAMQLQIAALTQELKSFKQIFAVIYFTIIAPLLVIVGATMLQGKI